MKTIDIVYTWVNGSDVKLKAKRASYLTESKNAGSEETRFESSNELQYSLELLFKHVDFVRKVFIITDNQQPNLESLFQNYPQAKEKIEIVDHSLIFKDYEHLLPTFNSLSIESMMWRIPNLQEHFLYMNDDFFIVKKLKFKQLFKKGVPVLRGKLDTNPRLKRLLKRSLLYIGLKGNMESLTASFNISLFKGAKLSGYSNKYLSISHYPNPLRKSTLVTLFDSFRAEFEKNASYRFRNYLQFNVVSAANHFELKNFGAGIKRPRDVYMQPAGRGPKYIDRKFQLAIQTKARYICIQSMDMLNEKELTKIDSHLRALI
ncbi:stealth family protein [Flavobacteriaceae bacterium]|nr:stealth family protein [Flavobacteriaceae bacterium]